MIFPRLLLFLLLLSATAALIGCATPEHSHGDRSAETLEPWTPTRLGQHPGDLGETPPLKRPPQKSFLEGSPLSATGYLAWRFYSHTFSKMAGETCQFAPSCSRFALDAVSEGPEGLILAFARLQRNHMEDDFYKVDDDGYLIDPTSHYNFWRSPLGLNAHLADIDSGHAWYIFLNATEELPEYFFDD